MSERFFSPEELEELGRRTLDHLTEAIDAADAERAKQMAQRMYNEFLGMHDGYRNFAAALLSEIGRRFGDEVLEEVMHAGVAAWWLRNLEAMDRAPNLRARAKMFAAGLRGHLQPMDVEEDDDKIVIKMKPCGSGGRLVLEGLYEGEGAFLKIAEPQRMTYGRADFPVYCAHEAAMERVAIERDGYPLVVVEAGAELGRDPCSFILYKDPDKIPEKYYERLGLTRPR